MAGNHFFISWIFIDTFLPLFVCLVLLFIFVNRIINCVLLKWGNVRRWKKKCVCIVSALWIWKCKIVPIFFALFIFIHSSVLHIGCSMRKNRLHKDIVQKNTHMNSISLDRIEILKRKRNGLFSSNAIGSIAKDFDQCRRFAMHMERRLVEMHKRKRLLFNISF